MMQSTLKRLSSLGYLARPLLLTFVGIVLLSIGVAYFLIALYHQASLPSVFYYLTLQFLENRWIRGLVLVLAGCGVLAVGIWQLSGVVVIPLTTGTLSEHEIVLGYRQASGPPRIVVLSGGPGMLRLASLGQQAARLTCITPVQDPVEYYYRAASLFNFENLFYIVPTPTRLEVYVELDDGSRYNIKQKISRNESLAGRHVIDVFLAGNQNGNGLLPPLEVTKQAIDDIAAADAIILGPGSLFESIIPNLLIPGIRKAIKESKARKIYVCNLMTEPGLTMGFGVGDHIRQIVRFGGFVPDYVLVNAQRIEPDVRQMYEAANQMPVYLTPEEYEETIVSTTDRTTAHDIVIEGATVVEADLAASVIQLSASLDQPGESRSVQVLRHDPDQLTAAIMAILKRE